MTILKNFALIITVSVALTFIYSSCNTTESPKDIDYVSIDYLSNTEKRALKSYWNDTHIEEAHKSKLKQPLKDQDYFYENEKRICKEADLEKIETNKKYAVSRLMNSLPYLNEEAVDFLDLLADRMTKSFEEKNIMYYRFVLTSVLRTEKDQCALQKINVNATPSETSHYYGTTFDISQTRFLLKKSNENKYSYRLRNILARELIRLQEEGKCYVLIESREKCFHITVRKQ